MKKAMAALIKKDLYAITKNKQLFSAVIAVPLIIGVMLPLMFVLILHFAPSEMGDFEAMLALLPVKLQGEGAEKIISLIINYMFPVFFLMIPLMAASVMAASAFVSEKEKQTLETLLLSPLSLKEIFVSKVLSAFILSFLVSLAAFLLMFLAVEGAVYLLMGSFIGFHISWLVIMLLVGPAISLLAIILIVRTSAKSQNAMEAQQRSVFLILPLLLLVAGQFTGVLLLDTRFMLALGLVLGAIALLMMKGAMKKFTYEKLLGIQ